MVRASLLSPSPIPAPKAASNTTEELGSPRLPDQVSELNPQALRALHLVANTNQSVFITGKAGTGKSTLLRHICKKVEKSMAVLAPTGVAALNVQGQTIHRFFGFPIDVTVDKIDNRDVRPRDPAIYSSLDLLIIDEVSMVRADILDCVDCFLRRYGPWKGLPFGGVQMVFVGDLYQLPPVVTRHERDIFQQLYPSSFFFAAHVMRDIRFEMVELTHVYRQEDQNFVALLNRVRDNTPTYQDIETLNTRHNPTYCPDGKQFHITLTTTNKAADAVNDEALLALAGKEIRSQAVIKGTFGKDMHPTATDLRFKVGAQIMMLNNDMKRRWVNGSLGVVKDITTTTTSDGKELLTVRVQLEDNGRAVNVMPYEWEMVSYQLGEDGKLGAETAGSFTQLPFRLAWAVTIHKSQGKTFDHIIVDLGRGAFSPGQVYVALSRCTSLEGIVLRQAVRRRDIFTDQAIQHYLYAQQNGN